MTMDQCILFMEVEEFGWLNLTQRQVNKKSGHKKNLWLLFEKFQNKYLILFPIEFKVNKLKKIGGKKMIQPTIILQEVQRVLMILENLNGLKLHMYTKTMDFITYLLIGLVVVTEWIPLMKST